MNIVSEIKTGLEHEYACVAAVLAHVHSFVILILLSVPFTGQLANLFVFPELFSCTESIVLLSPVFYVVFKMK
jgi:hypothetical protein